MSYFLPVDDSNMTCIFTLLILMITCEKLDAMTRHDDICGSFNGRRLYLEAEEHGFLTGRNITTSTLGRSGHGRVNSSHEQCSLELVTCPSCIIAVTFRHLDLSHRCGGANIVMDNPCWCDYVWVSEPPNGDVSGVPFCGILNTPAPTLSPVSVFYRSQTKTLSIVLLFSENHQHAFTLEYSAERNRQVLTGMQNKGLIADNTFNESRGGALTSPFFPALYPRDLGVEYLIKCQPNANANCRVRMIFRDFQLATLSIMEFYDWNGSRMEVSSGGVFRPPVIVTTGPSLFIRFYANGGTGLGYKAIYSFISGGMTDEIVKPITDCGGYVENAGGAITMMNMVSHGVKSFDCIWLIRPPKTYIRLKTHLYLKVATFQDIGGSTELQVLQGLTSDQSVIETLRHPVAQQQVYRSKEHVIPAEVGFYVGLRGAFGPLSRLAIVYSSFSYTDCFTGSDFLCQNHRCIPIQLSCDGFDHCGDSSDEPSTCSPDSDLEPHNRRGYSHTPNYYFPKMDRYPDLKTATVVFVASSLGMVLLISSLIVLLYHMGARARQQRELQSQLQSISDLLDGAHSSANSPPDEPPTYEAPPNYDEIIKVFLDPTESTRRKRKRQRGGSRRSRSSPAAITKNRVVPILVPLTSSPSIVSRSCQTTPFPDSPPPPYMSTPEPSCAAPATPQPRLSKRGARSRESWLLFREDSSTEQHLTVTQQLDCIENNSLLSSPLCNIENQTASVQMNPNLLWDSKEELLPVNPAVFKSGNFDSLIDNDEGISDIVPFKRVDSLTQRPHTSVDITEPGSDDCLVTCINNVCDCQGACGCASTLIGSPKSKQVVRSLSEGMSLPQNLEALDFHFSRHEVRSSEVRSHL